MRLSPDAGFRGAYALVECGDWMVRGFGTDGGILYEREMAPVLSDRGRRPLTTRLLLLFGDASVMLKAGTSISV